MSKFQLTPQDSALFNHSAIFAQKVWTTINRYEVQHIWESSSNKNEFIKTIEQALKNKSTDNLSDPDSIDLQSQCRGDKL